MAYVKTGVTFCHLVINEFYKQEYKSKMFAYCVTSASHCCLLLDGFPRELIYLRHPRNTVTFVSSLQPHMKKEEQQLLRVGSTL